MKQHSRQLVAISILLGAVLNMGALPANAKPEFQVFVAADGSEGQGFALRIEKDCLLVSPLHVVASEIEGLLRPARSIEISGANGARATAEFERRVADDLAVSRVANEHKERICDPPPYSGGIGAGSGDFLVWRNSRGDLEQTAVYRQSETGEAVIVAASSGSREMVFVKGRSGAALYSAGRRIGMLASVDIQGRGKVYRSDWIELLLNREGLSPTVVGQSGIPEIVNRYNDYMVRNTTGLGFELHGTYRNSARVLGNVTGTCSFSFSFKSFPPQLRKFDVRGVGEGVICPVDDAALNSPTMTMPYFKDSRALTQWRVLSETQDEIIYIVRPSDEFSVKPPFNMNSQNIALEFTFQKNLPFMSKLKMYSTKPFVINGMPSNLLFNTSFTLTFKVQDALGRRIPRIERSITLLESVDTHGKQGVIRLDIDELLTDIEFKKTSVADSDLRGSIVFVKHRVDLLEALRKSIEANLRHLRRNW